MPGSSNAQLFNAGRLFLRPYVAADREKWASFVRGCPDATFFHRIEWKEIIEQIFRQRTHYFLAERNGSVVGVLPLAETRSLVYGHSLVSLPFCIYGGAASTDYQAARGLRAAAQDLARELRVTQLELRHRKAQEPDLADEVGYVAFRKRITPEAEANMLAIPRKQRAMIRKGIKSGLRIEFDQTVDRFFALYTDNVRRHDLPPLPKHYFAALKQVFGEDCRILTVLDSRGEPVSTVMAFYFRGEVLPYYAGDNAGARELAANDFKYWELMRDACERGSTVFDFGRSKRGTVSFDLKLNWGFEPSPLDYEFQLYGKSQLHIPGLFRATKAFADAWKLLPTNMATAISPHLIRLGFYSDLVYE